MGLCVSRKVGKSVVLRIDGKFVARVDVSRVQDGKVQLYFDAGEEVEIQRGEIDAEKYPEPGAEPCSTPQ